MSPKDSVVLRGTGSAYPLKRWTTREIAELVSRESGETVSADWILERTGIENRFISDPSNPKESVSSLSTQAAEFALSRSGLSAKDIDHVIVATCSSELRIPSVSCKVASELGIPNANCVDLNAACTGFITALSAANSWLSTSLGKRALVIGADVLTPFVSKSDRNTFPIFGDGAGALVLERSEKGEKDGILLMKLGGDSSVIKLFELKDELKMMGPEAFRSAVRTLSDLCTGMLEKANLSSSDLKLVISHQANIRILEAVSKRVGISMDRFATPMRQVGNTSAASVPAALDDAIQKGALKQGDLALLCAYGAGVTYGGAIIRLPG